MEPTSSGRPTRPLLRQRSSAEFAHNERVRCPCRDDGGGEIVRFFARLNLGTAFATLIRQRHPMPSCGGLAPTAERTVDPARTIAESLTSDPGIREQKSARNCRLRRCSDFVRVLRDFHRARAGANEKFSRPEEGEACVTSPRVTATPNRGHDASSRQGGELSLAARGTAVALAFQRPRGSAAQAWRRIGIRARKRKQRSAQLVCLLSVPSARHRQVTAAFKAPRSRRSQRGCTTTSVLGKLVIRASVGGKGCPHCNLQTTLYGEIGAARQGSHPLHFSYRRDIENTLGRSTY